MAKMFKTASPFSPEEREKRVPLKGLSSYFDKKEEPKGAPKAEESDSQESSEMDLISAAEDSLAEAKDAINSGDTEAALQAIEAAEQHLAQCKSTDEEE